MTSDNSVLADDLAYWPDVNESEALRGQCSCEKVCVPYVVTRPVCPGVVLLIQYIF